MQSCFCHGRPCQVPRQKSTYHHRSKKVDDKVENYWACKSSFSNAIEGLDLTEAEELDLLVKWSGKESSEHVRRIISVHIRQLAAGLRMAWDRLEQCYGTPEAIESALFARLENFLKISSKDVQKLRDLADLLLEIEAAKEDHFLPDYLIWTQPEESIPSSKNFHTNCRTNGHPMARNIRNSTRYHSLHLLCFPSSFTMKLMPETTRASSFAHLVTLLPGERFRNNNMNSNIVDYRLKVHVFGNTPSPAVAIYGLRRAAREEEDSYGSDVRKFVEEDFYVDDALKSFATEEEAISVLQRA